MRNYLNHQNYALSHMLSALLLGVLFWNGAFAAVPESTEKNILEKRISIKEGFLVLRYADGYATLYAELNRPTPCSDWEMNVNQFGEYPPNGLEFDLTARTGSDVCLQALSRTQHLLLERIAAEDTAYWIRLGDSTVFSGTLSSSGKSDTHKESNT